MGGFDTVFVRFLAKSKQPSAIINTGMVITGILSGVLAIGFCFLTPVISPAIGFLAQQPFLTLLFAIFTIFTTWNTVTNAVLIAHKRGGYVLLINIVFSVIKLTLPFVIPTNDPMVIFSILGITQIVNVSLSIWAMIALTSYRPKLAVDTKVFKEIYKFGAASYFANLFNLLPDSLLPVIVLNQLGSDVAAYFYMAFTIANLLYTIVFSTSQATLAEASHGVESHLYHMRRGMTIVMSLLIPSIVIVMIAAPFVLDIFGHDYKKHADTLINILAISGIIIALYSMLSTYFKITHRLKAVVAMTAANSIAIIGLALVLTKPYGLTGVGVAWFMGSLIAVLVGFMIVILDRRRQSKKYLARPTGKTTS
jgi:O-antigen/teichoic acid export membrane protein